MSKDECGWDNKGALMDNLAKQIALLEVITHINQEIEKLRVSEQSLRVTIGEL